MKALLYLVGKPEICNVLTHFFNTKNILPAPVLNINIDTYIEENTAHKSIIIYILPDNSEKQLPSASLAKGRIVSCLLLNNVDDAMHWIDFQKKLSKNTKKDISILAQWNPHYLQIGNSWLNALQKNTSIKSNNWMADKVGKSNFLDNLAKGCHTCIYFGHGRHQKIVGYHGVSAKEISLSAKDSSITYFLSFSCYHLYHEPVHLSFGEILIKSHKVAVFWGSRIATDKTINAQLAKICQNQYVSAGNITMYEWINNVAKAVEQESNPLLKTLWKSYSLLGNPLLPLN